MIEELPKTLLEAVRYFSDLDKCDELMKEVKWPNGKIVCPKCGGESISPVKGRRKLQCNSRACKRQFSFKVGTIFEDSPLGLDKWFVALWSVANCKNGISSTFTRRSTTVEVAKEGTSKTDPVTGAVGARGDKSGKRFYNKHKLYVERSGEIGWIDSDKAASVNILLRGLTHSVCPYKFKVEFVGDKKRVLRFFELRFGTKRPYFAANCDGVVCLSKKKAKDLGIELKNLESGILLW